MALGTPAFKVAVGCGGTPDLSMIWGLTLSEFSSTPCTTLPNPEQPLPAASHQNYLDSSTVEILGPRHHLHVTSWDLLPNRFRNFWKTILCAWCSAAAAAQGT